MRKLFEEYPFSMTAVSLGFLNLVVWLGWLFSLFLSIGSQNPVSADFGKWWIDFSFPHESFPVIFLILTGCSVFTVIFTVKTIKRCNTLLIKKK